MKKWLMLKVCVLTILLFGFGNTHAQRRKSTILKYDTAARQGQVHLTDGTVLAGRVLFNDNDGVVTIFDDEDSQSFNSRNITQFQFYDRHNGRERVFYSLEFTDPETGIKDQEIFEVLKELKMFAVLMKIDRVKTQARKGLLEPRPSPILVERVSKQYIQTQTIYFMDTNGEFEPYVRILEKERDGLIADYNETNNRYIDATLFEKYTGNDFKTLQEFAKQNNLSFKRKEDIIQILDEFERMSKGPAGRQ